MPGNCPDWNRSLQPGHGSSNSAELTSAAELTLGACVNTSARSQRCIFDGLSMIWQATIENRIPPIYLGLSVLGRSVTRGPALASQANQL